MRIACVSLLFVLLAGAPGRAYVRTADSRSGACLFWPTREVRWVLNEKGSADASFGAVRAALQRSFAAWADADCSDLAFRDDGPTPRIDTRFDRAAADNVNLVVWRERECALAAPPGDPCFTVTARSEPSCADLYDCWDHGPGIIALTSMNYGSSSGVIWDGDVEFNGAPDANGLEFRFTASLAEGPVCATPADTGCVATDVQNTATHEIGHLLGFAHTPVADATMFASAPFGETGKRSLAEDDLAALCETYPTGAPPATCTPSGRIAVVPDEGCAAAPAGLLGLLPLALVRRRRPERVFSHVSNGS